MFEGFDSRLVPTDRGAIHVRTAGTGPAVLLLHGYPQTSANWHRVAPTLAERGYSVVVADLPGYGRSEVPPLPDIAAFSKRAMAATLVAAMSSLGWDRFAVVGHDRGGRVAYRLTLDHPEW